MATAIAEIATDPLIGEHVVALSALATSGGTDFLGAVLKSLVVILVTEIGDKTFFIAAVRTHLSEVRISLLFYNKYNLYRRC